MKAHQYLATSIATLLATMGGQRANALPQGEAVAHGEAHFKRDGGRMEIRASDRAVINFRGFNIDRNEAVTFVQPGAKSRVLNRVTDGNPTRIFGQLHANGQVMLVNPSGVFFENGSMVNVGGIIAAAGKISDSDFIAGKNRFTELTGEVSNAGTIHATGDVSLVGAHVSNSGIIESGEGMVSMVAGDDVLVGERGGNVYVSHAATPGKAAKAGVSNTGKIVAKKALLGAGDFYAVAVQHSGEIHAEDVAVRGGKGGRVEVSGKIDVSARGKGKKGGRIEVTGETVALTKATLDASGDLGGGEVLVGGDWQGGGTVSRAQTTTVDAATVIQADAVKDGVGGKVVVWADRATQFDGQIFARGVGAGQAGGEVETSGKLTLGVGQTARVDASSAQGKMGNWLLDPTDLIIEAGGTGTIGGADEQKVDASVINTAAATVTLTATNDITFNQAIAMAKAGAGLTATAGGNLVVNDVTIATNNGEINFTADSDKNGSGFLTLSVGSKLTTKGAGVNLTVDHGSATSTDGIKIFGDIDTRTSATGFGKLSTFQLKGSAQTGVLEVGAVTLNGGDDRGTPIVFSHGDFDLYADEINLTGGADSVKGTGHLNLRPASLTTNVKVLAADDDTAGQLDITATDLDAISSEFTGVGFGRSNGEGSVGYTGTVVVGDEKGASLAMDRGKGGPGTISFESGVNGVIANVNIQAINTSYVHFRGNVITVKAGVSAPDALVSFHPFGNSNVEVLNMYSTGGNPATVPGILRLDNAMLKSVGDNSNGLAIGNEQTNRSSKLTFFDPIRLDSGAGAKDGRVLLNCGGTVIFNKPSTDGAIIDAGLKSLEIRAGAIEFKDGTSSLITSKGNAQQGHLSIRPSQASEYTNSKRSLEVYDTTPDSALTDVLTLKKSDLYNLASNFTGILSLGSGHTMIGGDVVINTALDFTGKKITGLTLTAPERVLVKQPITMGLGGPTGATKQSLGLYGREVEIQADLTGVGNLQIFPVDNTYQSGDQITYPGGNPLSRGMLIGTASNDSDNGNHLTITADEFAKIKTGFNEIYFGRDGMTGDLEVRGSTLTLPASTRLQASSTIKLYGKIDGNGKKYSLWARGLEVDVDNKLDTAPKPKSLSNLKGFNVNTMPSAQVPGPRKIVVNGTVDQGPFSLDLTESDLSWIDGPTVDSVVIGFDGYTHNYVAAAGSNLPIEVVGGKDGKWTLTANTELRSANRIYSEKEKGSPAVYGSIIVRSPVDGAGYNLTLRSDSELKLLGGDKTITNVRTLKIEQHKLDVPILLLGEDTQANREKALVLSRTSYAALGSNIVSLDVGRADSMSNLLVSGDMTLVTNTTLTTGNYNNPSIEMVGTGQLLRIDGSIVGKKTLTLNSFGTTQVAGSIGSEEAPLASFEITKGTDVTGVDQRTIIGSVNGPAVRVLTTGNQIYRESVELLSGGTLEAGGTLTVFQTLAAGANDLALLANEMVFSGAAVPITGTGVLTLGAGTPETNVAFYSASTTDVASQLDITRAKMDKFALGSFSKLIIGRANGTGSLSVKENFGLLQETLIQTGGGALTIEKQINGAQKLTLSSGSGAIDAKAALGATTALGDLSVLSTGTATFRGAVNAASVFTDAGGSTVLNAGAVTTSGLQDYNDAVVLGAPTTLTSSGAGDINLNAGATGAFALNINTSGVTRLKSAVTVASVKTNVGGTVELAANITTTGTQQYLEQAVLSGDTQLTGTTVTFDETLGGGGFGLLVTGNAQFAKELTSLSTLAVTGNTSLNGGLVSTSGAQTYGGNVTLGKNTTLTSTALGDIALNGGASGGFALNINTSGTTRLAGTINLGSITTDAGGTVELPGLVTTSGAQTYSDAAVLGAATTLTSTGAGAVALNGGASGAHDLRINTSGVTTLGGGINVASITTDVGGTVKLSGDIQTTGTQSYGEAAQLVGNTTLTGTTVSFADTIAGVSNSLGVTGNAVLNGAATGLSTLSVSGTTALNGGTVTTTGTQTYTGAVTLGNNATLTGSTVSFGSTVAGGSKSLAVTGNAALNGTVSGLSTLGVTGTTLLNTSAVSTSGAQTYGGNVTLGQDAVLASTAGGDVTLNGGAAGNQSLAINTSGVTQLGGGINVGSITTDTGGTVELSGDIQTTGTQSYGEAAQLVGNTTLTGTTVSFADTIAGGSKSLGVTGNAVFNAAATGLSTLSVSGTTALNGGTVTTTGTQTYTGAVTLGSNAALTGSTVSFGNTVAGGSNSLAVTGNAGFNGAVSGLSTLGVTGTTLLNTSAVTTSGAQTYGGKVTLGQDAVLTSTGSGDVTMNAGATGDKALAINTDGVTQLGGGISVGSITTDTGGTVKLSGNIQTTGTQSYGEAAQLVGNTTLSGTTVSFADTIAGGSNSLGVTGNAVLNGAATGLSTLGVTGTTLLNTSAVTTSGAQTYGGKVTLGQDAVLASTAGGQIALNGGATGGKSLAINTSGVTQLGGGISLGSITTDMGGTVKLSGNIQTTGTQSYGEAAQLLGNTTLTGTTASFADTIAGGSNSLAVAGNAVLNGAATGLSTLSVSGTTALNGGTVTTTGTQTYTGAVTLGSNAALTGSNVSFGNTIAGGSKSLAVSGNAALNGAATGLSSLSVSGTTALDGGTVTTTGTQTYTGAVTLGNNAALTGSTVSFGNTIAGGSKSLGVTGNAALNGAATGLSTLAVSGTTALNGGTVTTTGTQTYTGAVTLGNNAALTGSNVSFGNTIAGGSKSLAVAGNAALNGAATGLSTLSVSGTTALNGGTVTTSGTQTYTGAVTLGSNAALTGSTVSFGNTIAGGSKSLAVTGNAAFNGTVSGVSTLGVTGTTLLNTSAVTTSGAQTYGGKVTLGQDAVLASTGSGDVTMNAGATGDKTLAINTDGVTQLGGGISVGSITTDVGGTVKLSGDIQTTGTQSYGEVAQLVGNTTLSGSTVSFGNTVTGGSNSLAVAGNAEFNGAVSGVSTLGVTGTTLLNASAVTTSGAQTYGGKVTLGQDTVLASTGSGDVTMNAGATGDKKLAINTSGVTQLGGGINVGSITTDVGGTVKLSGDIQTTGTQSYGEAAQLVGNTTLSGSTVSFGNTVAGGSNSLAVAGNAEFNGAVSGVSTLGVTGTTLLNTSAVTTSGAQTYGGKVTLAQDTVLSSSESVSINGGAAGDKALAINTGGVTRLGGGISVGSVTTDAGGTVELSGEITTSGAQTYNDAAVLTGATTLASTGGGAVVLGNGLNGGFDLSVNTAGATQLGGGVNVGSITTDAAGSVDLSGAITTTGAQTYNDAATLTGATTLSSTGGGALALKSGATGASELALNTSGATQLAGGISVASLSTDAGGATEITGDVTTTGAQTYGDAVQVSGPVALSSTGGGALTLGAGVDGAGSVSLVTSGNVTVTGDSGATGALQGFSAKGARVEVGGVQATGDVTLDTSDLLVLQGASYKAGDTLSLNPTARATASGRSSIVKPTGDVALEANKFVMGAGQKLVVSNGALSITAANGVVGDLAASVAMDLNVDQLQVVARDAGDFTNAGLKDLGLSIVSPKITFNGTLAYSPDSTGAKKVVWNTANGAVSGRNNITKLSGSGVGKNAKMSEQFNSVDADGYVLQPLAVKPPVVVPPEVIDPATPLPTPSEPLPTPSEGFRSTQFDLMNWSLGYRDETLENPNGIWVIRSLGTNGRWDNLGRIIAGQESVPKTFIEL